MFTLEILHIFTATLLEEDLNGRSTIPHTYTPSLTAEVLK